MTPPDIGAVLTRIAGYTSTIRTRTSDAARAEHHGNGEADANIQALLARLRKVADDLEKAIR